MAMYRGVYAVDPTNPQDTAAGLAGQVFDANDFARDVPLTVTDLSGNVYAQNRIVAGVNGFVSPFIVPDGPVEVVWVSGPWVVPLESVSGVRALAVTAQGTADIALERVTILEENGVGTGGEGGPITSDKITDATPVGVAIITAATGPAVRQQIGAGTSSLTLGTTAGTAAPGSDVLFKTGTTGQTVAPRVTFQQPPVVPVDSFTQDRIVGLIPRLEPLELRRDIVIIDDRDSAIPSTARTNDILFTRTAPTGTTDPGDGGGTPTTPTLYRQFLLNDVTSSTAVTTSGGTGDTPLDSITGTAPTVVANTGGIREVILPNSTSAGPTLRWTSVSPGSMTPLNEFSFSFGLRVIAYPTTASTFLVMGGVLQLVQTSSGSLSILTAAGAFVIGTPGSLPIDGIYTIKGWRGTTGNTEIRVYAPDGSTFWSQSRDLGQSPASSFIWGRTGTAAGQLAFSRVKLNNATGELTA